MAMLAELHLIVGSLHVL